MKRRTDALLSHEQITAALVLYRRGLSVRALARQGWQAWGFASADAATRSLYHAFRLRGATLRTYRQALALRQPPVLRDPEWQKWHGEGLCQGRKVNYPGRGESCRRRVHRGSRFCVQHDPSRAGERRARLAQVRAART